ncbi:50S ribosomal protein L32 [Candidatus Babeliales bacterium]|nr:50S ribosomal protein L32 [Candidatus Babeliales bacterium]MCF7899254.1 50S ribosomal protein L32 [Candidatus Babeliales bacterium]
MPVPKRKVSKSRRDIRSANKGVKVKSIAVCQTCQAAVLPHKVCKECGHYKGVKVLRTKTDRLYSRSQSRQEKTKQYEASKGNAQQGPSKEEKTKE